MHLRTFKNLLLKNHRTYFNQSWHKASLGDGDSIFFSNEGTCRFLRGDNNEIDRENILTNFKILFSRIAGPISTKLGRKHSWVKGIQLYFNEGPLPFSRGDNKEIVKIHWRTLKNHRVNFNQTWHKASLGEGKSCFFNWRVMPFSKGR